MNQVGVAAEMNRLLRRALVMVVLASTNPALAQSDDGPAQQAGSANGQNRLRGPFFVEDRRAGPLNTPSRDAVRASIRQKYPDVAEVLGIDAATAQKLLDLLTDQQLSTLETSRLDTTPRASSDWLLSEAAAESGRIDALRGVLGEQRWERYLDYSTTVRERTQVATFDARLPAEHKLLAAQKEQMIELYREDTARRHRKLRAPHVFERRDSDPAWQPGDHERAMQLATIAANEAQLRTISQSHRQLSLRAAHFLSQPQLAVLSHVHAEEEGSLRHWIEHARSEAGLEPTLPDAQLPVDESSGLRTLPAVQVKVDIALTVDRNESRLFSYIAMNGDTLAFEAGDGLLVEATPTLDGDSLEVEWAYYEQRGTRKRRLIDMASVSTLRPSGAPFGVEKLTVTAGSKAYAIKANVSLTVL